MKFFEDTDGNTHAVSQIAKIYKEPWLAEKKRSSGVQAVYLLDGERITVYASTVERLINKSSEAIIAAHPETQLVSYYPAGDGEEELVSFDRILAWSVDQFGDLRPLFIDRDLSEAFHDDSTAVLHPAGSVEGWDGNKWPTLTEWIQASREFAANTTKAA